MPEVRRIVTLIEEWIEKNFPLPAHLLRTEYWLLELDPDAGDALRVAALLHDVDRVFALAPGEELPVAGSYDSEELLAWHSARSARCAASLLEGFGASREFIEEVSALIAVHEVGGAPRADLLMEADSISFLENNVGFFVREITPDVEEARAKTEYMYRRIRSEAARGLAAPIYRRVMEKLDGYNEEFRPAKGLDPYGMPLG